jgi:hypothetical protein
MKLLFKAVHVALLLDGLFADEDNLAKRVAICGTSRRAFN